MFEFLNRVIINYLNINERFSLVECAGKQLVRSASNGGPSEARHHHNGHPCHQRSSTAQRLSQGLPQEVHGAQAIRTKKHQDSYQQCILTEAPEHGRPSPWQ